MAASLWKQTSREEEEPKMRDLIDLRLSNWKNVGRQLGFPESELDRIESSCSRERDVYSFTKRKIFCQWKVKHARRPTNRTIVQALIDAEEYKAADKFCQKHGIDQRSCERAPRVKPKEPVHSLGQLNVMLSCPLMEKIFIDLIHEPNLEFYILMNKLRPELLNCNWKEIVQEIQYRDLPNFNFYPNTTVDSLSELCEIFPILFHGKTIFTKQLMQKYSDLNRLKKIFKRSLNDDTLKINLPRSWYLVVCILYFRKGIISLEQYKDLARECCVPENEICTLLNYVHKHFGLLLHFADVPGLKEVVICSSTEFFVKFRNLNEHILHLNPLIHTNGLASKSMIDKFIEGSVWNHELKMALQLMKHYYLVVEPINHNDIYFFPFLLQDDINTQIFSEYVGNSPAPLLITFSTDQLQCIFHSLHGYLSQHFQLLSGRNKMSFFLDTHQIGIFVRTEKIIVRIYQNVHQINSHVYENLIRHILMKALQILSKTYDNINFAINFCCPGVSHQPQINLHLSEVTDDSKLRCLNNPPCHQLTFDCQDIHLVWNLKNNMSLCSSDDDEMEVVDGRNTHDIRLLETRLEEEGGLPFNVVKAVFYGPPFCGKTTACRRLTGALSNLSENPTSCGSTGIDAPITLNLYHDINQTSVFINSSQKNDWAPQSVQQQIEMMVHYFLQTQPLSRESSLSTQSTMFSPSVSQGTLFLTEPPNSLNQRPLAIESSNVDVHTRHSPNGSTDVHSQMMLPCDNEQILESSFQPPPKHEVIGILKDLIQQGKFKEIRQCFNDIQGGTLLSIIDTGGQAEFQDILPLLIRGPSLFLMFLKLDLPLDEQFNVSYRNRDDEESFIKYQSMYTQRDVLHQLLALCDSLEEESAALLVGSYKDKVSQETIDEIDASIQDSLKNAEFFKRDFIKMCGKSYLYPLDNMNGDTEEIVELQDLILRKIKKFSRKRLPVSWGLFHLLLKYIYEEEKICSLQQAKEIAVQLKIPEDDVPKVLEYIDHNFGTILYYSDVPCLQDTVICDPNVIFEPIAKLVAESFGANPDTPKSAELIRKSGNVPLSVVKKICRESNTVIPISSIIEIFKCRGIVIEKEEKNSGNVLFMPCLLLPDPSVEDYETNINDFNPAPLIFTFSSGFVPPSLFHTLVIKLSSCPEWSLHTGRFKNKMEFLFCDKNPSLIEIISHISFLEVRIVENHSHQKCFDVRNEISTEIKEILSSHSHMKKVSFSIAFYCPNDINIKDKVSIHDHVRKHHPAECLSCDNPCRMVCSLETCPRPKTHPLLSCHRIWFEEDAMETSTLEADARNTISMNSRKGNENNEQLEMPMEIEDNEILKCDSPTIILVMTEIQEIPADQLSILGFLLGISKGQVDKILAAPVSNADSLLKHKCIVVAWLEDGKATWRSLVEKLKHSLLKLNSIANSIEVKYVA